MCEDHEEQSERQNTSEPDDLDEGEPEIVQKIHEDFEESVGEKRRGEERELEREWKSEEDVDPMEALAEYANSMTFTNTAREYEVKLSTLDDKPQRGYEKKHLKIAKTQGRNVKKSVDVPAVWAELESGTSLRRTAKKHEMSHPTLYRILRREN